MTGGRAGWQTCEWASGGDDDGGGATTKSLNWSWAGESSPTEARCAQFGSDTLAGSLPSQEGRRRDGRVLALLSLPCSRCSRFSQRWLAALGCPRPYVAAAALPGEKWAVGERGAFGWAVALGVVVNASAGLSGISRAPPEASLLTEARCEQLGSLLAVFRTIVGSHEMWLCGLIMCQEL